MAWASERITGRWDKTAWGVAPCLVVRMVIISGSPQAGPLAVRGMHPLFRQLWRWRVSRGSRNADVCNICNTASQRTYAPWTDKGLLSSHPAFLLSREVIV